MQRNEKPAISWNLERLRISEAETRERKGKSKNGIDGGARISEILDLWQTSQRS